MIGQDTLEELTTLRSDARQAAESFSVAVKEQAEKAGIAPGALRRYVCAMEADRLATLDAEAADLATLIERHHNP